MFFPTNNPMQWYYAVNNERQGPVPDAEFESLVATGVIKGDTLVWNAGMSEWKPYAQVAASGAAATATAVTPGTGDEMEVCAVSGKRYPRREMINFEGKWIAAEHRDAYFQRLREGVSQPGGDAVPGPYGYGGFWRRFLARFVDGLIVGVAGVLIGVVAAMLIMADPQNTTRMILIQVVTQLISLAIGISYEVFFIRKYDATPGKMALGLKLLRVDGSKLSVGRVIGRYFSHIISALPLMIGYIMAGFDEEKRALHDRICDTRVIKTK
ncbi:MAG: RDD family protein [Opitutaceae bacterium]|nr:RDD family protein [Opitutaceae bacterium]